MNLQIEWMRPIQLSDASKQKMLYDLNLSKIPRATAGVYIFGRRLGSQFEALYVGQATKLNGRIHSHLNDLRLMQHLQQAKRGARIVLAGRIKTRRGQKLDRCLRLAELALIRHFLSNGDDLINKQGRRLWRHSFESSGQSRKPLLPRTINYSGLTAKRGGTSL